MKELEYPFDSDFLLKKKIRLKKQLMSDGDIRFIDKRIAILGGSTTDEIRNILELFLLNSGIRPTFYESEYNRYYEEGMFDNEKLVKFNPEIILIHTSVRNVINWPDIQDDEAAVQMKVNAMMERFCGLWDHLYEKYRCTIIQNNFELPLTRLMGNQDGVLVQGGVRFVGILNERFSEYGRTHDFFYIHDIHYESADYGLRQWSNPYFWHMYKYAMAVPAIPTTAYGYFLIIKSILGKNRKVLALDLDNTLWGGVIGDDGVENIEIGQETALSQTYSEFQDYVKKLKDIGVVLSVVSKNNEDTAKSGFERPDSVLKLNDFVAFSANWLPKNINLLQQAQDLNLGADAFVFVDDNPAEREIVRQNTPAIVPEIDNVETYMQTLDRAGYFEVSRLSKDDLQRSEMYMANQQRRQALATFADYREYLLSLKMEAEIKPFEPIYMARIAQLTNKSNQFNLTTKRYTQQEIEKIAEDEKYLTLYGRLSDRFGDNGVVSIIIGAKEDHLLHVDLWLMSCRVLKRDMEFAMMDKLVDACKENGIDTIYGYYYPTAKNAMVSDFYALQGFKKIEEDAFGNTKWKYAVEENYNLKNTVIEVNIQEK